MFLDLIYKPNKYHFGIIFNVGLFLGLHNLFKMAIWRALLTTFLSFVYYDEIQL